MSVEEIAVADLKAYHASSDDQIWYVDGATAADWRAGVKEAARFNGPSDRSVAIEMGFGEVARRAWERLP